MKQIHRRFRGTNNQPPIVKRKQSYDFDGLDKRFYFRNNSVLSSLFTSLSAVFPPGEREFVRSVFHFRDQIGNEALLKEATMFAAQEGEHARQHRRANDALQEMGYPTRAIAAHLEREIKKKVETVPAEDLLAVTVSLEHITAILADFLLSNQHVLDDMPEPVRELLFWHAVEEIEHKAVAFDVYMEVCGDRARLVRAYRFITLMFIFRVVTYSASCLVALRHRPKWRELVEAKEFLFGNEGFISNIGELYRDFCRPGFHPWDHDNSELIEDWKARSKLAA